MFPPADKASSQKDYRRSLENHIFRTAVVGQIVPQLGGVRWEQLDASPYLLGMPGGTTVDLRTGEIRKMDRSDFLTRRLRITAKDIPTPCYDYFLRSISSANDRPANEEFIAHLGLFLGYCLIGHYDFHIWPLWTGSVETGRPSLPK